MTDIDTGALNAQLAAVAADLDLDPADFAAGLADYADRLRAGRAENAILDQIRAVVADRLILEERWRELVVVAAHGGVPKVRIAKAAGITPQWVSALARAQDSALAAV